MTPSTRELVNRLFGQPGEIFEDGPLGLALKDMVHFSDDFFDMVTAHKWTTIVSDGGSVAVGDAVNGQVVLTAHTDDNDEVYLVSTNEVCQFLANKRFAFEARVKITEAATNHANVLVGVMDAAAADALLDDGGGPAASYDGAVFFKVKDGTKWQFESSNGATQVTDTDVGTRTSGSWVRLGFTFVPDADGVHGQITPYVDGVQASEAQEITLSGLDEMHIVFGVKAATAAEVLTVDYVQVVFDR